MAPSRLDVLSCVEHERLTFELLEVRTRGQYLTGCAASAAKSRPSGTGGSAWRWRSWWITNWSMAAAVESFCSAEGKPGVALPDTKW